MLKVEDRVSRQAGLNTNDKRHGTIVEVYVSRQGSYFSNSVRMYAIMWDDSNEVERGYLEEGLQKE